MIVSSMNSKTPVEKHFDEIAPKYDYFTKKREIHYSVLKRLLKSLIPERKNVFEVGCGTGDLLFEVRPVKGYGMDISSKMVALAKSKYKGAKNLEFSVKWPKESFDYIFMSDVIEHLEKPAETFASIRKLMGPKTVFINTMMNPLWIPVEKVYNFFSWKMPEGPHNRIRYKKIESLIDRAGMKIIKHDYKLLMPIKIPLITNYLNNYIEKYLKPLAFIEYFIAVKK